MVLPQNVEIKNQGFSGSISPATMTTKALVNGEKFTCDHRNMWVGHLPPPQTPPVYLEIIIHFQSGTELSALKVWNYNKSVRDSTKGVREVEVFLNNEIKYEGTVRMGRGQTDVDFSQLITFREVAVEQEAPKQIHSHDVSFSNKAGGSDTGASELPPSVK